MKFDRGCGQVDQLQHFFFRNVLLNQDTFKMYIIQTVPMGDQPGEGEGVRKGAKKKKLIQ